MKFQVAFLLLVVVAAVASKTVTTKAKKPLGIERLFRGFDGARPPRGTISKNARTVEGRFSAPVDHFNPQNRDRFEFNYLSNDQYYRPGGPLFIVVGGHYAIDPYFMENSHFRDIAALNGAWLFTNEHRYFGTSSPVESYSLENLRFLRTEQALSDLIDWIDYLRREVVGDPNATVILHGIGYAGALASWARQRFPQIVTGAWASSAPIRAAVNFSEFSEDFGNTIRIKGSDECYNSIFRAFHTLENLLDIGLVDLVSERFNTCAPVDTESDLAVQLFLHLITLSLEAAMFEDFDIESIAGVCNRLTDDTYETSLDALSDYLIDRYQEERECFDLSIENFLRYLHDEDIEAEQNLEFGLRQLNYHICTEYGFFQTANSFDQPFGSKVGYDLFLEECAAVFGDWLSVDVIYEGVRLTNLHFGATDPRVTNVFYTNGGIDPIRYLSVTQYTNILASARVTPRAFFGEDVTSISGYDTEEMLDTKHEIELFVNSWLGPGIAPLRR